MSEDEAPHDAPGPAASYGELIGNLPDADELNNLDLALAAILDHDRSAALAQEGFDREAMWRLVSELIDQPRPDSD